MSDTALYAGSLDPITSGHLDIIERGASLFDKVVIGVIDNPNKNGLFTFDERVELVKRSTAHLSNVSVESFSGLLADYVNDRRFDAVLRGLRNSADFEYELQMAQINDRLYRYGTQTVFLMTRPELSYISSSAVKEIALLGGDISGMVPETIIDNVIQKAGGACNE